MDDTGKIKIIDDIIKHTPPGGLNHVINDLRSIVNNDKLMLSKSAPRSVAEYDRDQCIFVKVGNMTKYSMITNESVYEGSYYDPRQMILFTYDHINKNCKLSKQNFQQKQYKEHEKLWKSLDSCLEEYVENFHHDGKCVVYDISTGGGPVIFKLYIMTQEISENNFRSGRWRSQFTISMSSSKANSFSIKGVVKAHVHGYENGNFQLVSWHDEEKTIEFAKKEFGPSAIKCIEDFETKYQESLNKEFNNISATTFKALRRKLPVTRSRIDWEKIEAYRL